MKKILIVNAYYYPGFRSGGPQQTIMNIVDVYSKEYSFYILTRNHDFGDSKPYSNVTYDTWVHVGKAQVYYSSKESNSLIELEKIVLEFNLIYICEPYQPNSYKLLALKRMGKIKNKVVLAPMGCFSKGAISQKFIKKKIFWTAFKLCGLDRNIVWSITSERELNEAKNVIGYKHVKDVIIAEDLPRKYETIKKITRKEKGTLRIIFLSRICPQKNLIYAINVVKELVGDIIFDIYGILEDKSYWKKCQEAMRKISANVNVQYCGEVKSENVIQVFSNYDVFIFPTLGENYGHVIYEAMMAGCIPVISDRTPWSEIDEKGCGTVCSLENFNKYVEAVQMYVNKECGDIAKIAKKAQAFSKEKYLMQIEQSAYGKVWEQ